MSTSVLKTMKCGRVVSSSVVRSRAKHTLSKGESRMSVEASTVPSQQQPHQQMHQVVAASQTSFPSSGVIIPPNVKELEASEKAQFSPFRARDTSSAHIAAFSGFSGSDAMRGVGARENSYNFSSIPSDSHINVYDLGDTLSLDSSIQSNVPQPFGLSGQAPSHFSSPDCHRGQDDKYVAGDLQDHHEFKNKTSKKSSGTAFHPSGSFASKKDILCVKSLPNQAGHSVRSYVTTCYNGRLVVARTQPVYHSNLVRFWPINSISDSAILCGSVCARNESREIHTCMTSRSKEQKSDQSGDSESQPVQLSSKQKLQRAVKEYGSTVIVFHVAISLTSLGICYLLVSSGVDMTGFIKSLGFNLGNIGEDAAEIGKESATASQLESSEITKVEGEDADVNTRRAAGAATFVVAYAVHKVFAPVRIGITLTSTPFIVRYLRRVGFLKPPKSKSM